MRDGVARLRLGLAVGAGCLLLIVGGFLGYARYRSRAFLAGLPGRLGAEITRETNGYTYSQTVEGRTVFTLRAAKLEQRRDGLVRLHDVGIVVYGRKADRADRIYGSEFEYDQAGGVVRALGKVHIDLQAPAPAADDQGGKAKKARAAMAAGAEPAGGDAKMLHVETSGLVYLTKLNVAATKEEIEFSEGSMSGRARGAEFRSDEGVVVLQSAVRMEGVARSGPVVVTADRAELDRDGMVAHLAGAKVVTQEETAEAAQAVVHLRGDGSPEDVEGLGAVTVAQGAGGVLRAGHGQAGLDDAGRPTEARFAGGVRYEGGEAGRHTEGSAGEARIAFDPQGRAQRVVMMGAVTLEDRAGGGAAAAANVRRLTAATVDVALALGAGGGAAREVRDAVASGAARLVLVESVASAAGRPVGPKRTELAGDELKAHFVGGRQVGRVVAVGHTVLRQVAPDGAGSSGTGSSGSEATSTGDSTEMLFRERRAGAAGGGGGGMEELAQADQVGHVTMLRRLPGGKGKGQDRGTADRAVYDADANRVTLTGAVMLTDGESTVWGRRVTVERGSGDATAEGEVRVSYTQAGGRAGDPVHVVSERAEMKRGSVVGTDTALFYGNLARPARLWQGSSQVEAPVLRFEQGGRRLTANGPGVADVHAAFAGAGGQLGGADGAKGGTVRVVSREMVYVDGAREVLFRGGVLAENADGTLRAERATVLLAAAKGPGVPAGYSGCGVGGTAKVPFVPAGSVERMVATGRVAIDQPGRHGTGTALVYTAADGLFVLTGEPGAPPRLVDETRGTVTGQLIQFHASDERVVVDGRGIERGGPERARTRTRVKQ